MTRMYRKLVATLDHAAHCVDVREIEARVDALRIEVHRERDEVDVAGALAIAEQAPFDAVRARHQRELRSRDRGAAIIMRMHREHDAVPIGEVAVHPFDLIGVHVSRAKYNSVVLNVSGEYW
jgi:hypothetical protein